MQEFTLAALASVDFLRAVSFYAPAVVCYHISALLVRHLQLQGSHGIDQGD